MQIYGLIDPRDSLIHYVGKTNKASRRLIEHRNEHGRVNPDKTEWLDSLQRAGLDPVMTILETCEDGQAEARELYWIGYGREQGWPLVNKAHGYLTTQRKLKELIARAVSLGLLPKQVNQFDPQQQRLLLGILVEEAEKGLVRAYDAMEAARHLAEQLEAITVAITEMIHEIEPTAEFEDYGLERS